MKNKADIQRKMVAAEMERIRVSKAIFDPEAIAHDTAVLMHESATREYPSLTMRQAKKRAVQLMARRLDELTTQIETLNWVLHNGD